MWFRSFAPCVAFAVSCVVLVPVDELASQKRAARETTTSVPYVVVTGIDYLFQAPEVVPAGVVTFNLVNNGNDLHAMAIFELPASHTLRDFLDQYHSHRMIPVWMNSVGHTATIAPKAEVFLTVRMKPGRYILACLIPAQDGRLHTEKGMVTLVTAR